MIARLTALVLFTIFSGVLSISAFAGQSEEALTERRLKLLASCGVNEAAKTLTLAYPVVIAGIFSDEVATELRPYQAVMSAAATCDDFAAAYALLVRIYQKHGGQDPEVYFASTEGAKALATTSAELRKLVP